MIVFVLELTNGKYFIGHTYKKEFKMDEFQKNKIYWTRKYTPVHVIEQLENATFETYIETINDYMEIYGIKNVYSSIELNIDYCNEFVMFDDPSIEYENMDDERKSEIIRYIKRQYNCSCILCGNVDHVVSECNKYDVSNVESKLEKEYGYDSIEIDNNQSDKTYENSISHDNSCQAIDFDIMNDEDYNTNDINKLKEQRDYYYNLSYYWYYQMSYLYQYYEQYMYSYYNNQYNYLQM